MLTTTTKIAVNFQPRQRVGTKTFLDLSREARARDLFETVAGRHFQSILPSEVWDDVVTAILDTGIESVEAQRWLEYATSFDGEGRPVSPIAQMTTENYKNPEGFKILYGEESASTLMDAGYKLTYGAQAIDSRLQCIIEKLPAVIVAEREKLGLKDDEKYIIFNIGSGHSLDTVYMLHQNPELQNLVEIVCVDPDINALEYGEALAVKLEVRDSFTFVAEKIQDAKLGKAHLILFIGMFCPVPTKTCVMTLGFVKKYLADEGIIIFSTVQEKMLLEGALLDFIMWSYNWLMFFKSENEPGEIVRKAGLIHEKGLDWEDAFGYNRMTVARKPAESIIGGLKTLISLAIVMIVN